MLQDDKISARPAAPPSRLRCPFQQRAPGGGGRGMRSPLPRGAPRRARGGRAGPGPCPRPLPWSWYFCFGLLLFFRGAAGGPAGSGRGAEPSRAGPDRAPPGRSGSGPSGAFERGSGSRESPLPARGRLCSGLGSAQPVLPPLAFPLGLFFSLIFDFSPFFPLSPRHPGRAAGHGEAAPAGTPRRPLRSHRRLPDPPRLGPSCLFVLISPPLLLLAAF